MPSYEVISEPACRWDRNEGQIESGVLGGFRETVRTQRNANQEFLESKVRLNAIEMTLEILRTRNAILKFPPVEAFALVVSRNPTNTQCV